MPTQCRPEQLVFAPVEGRSVVASFTGGVITSDAGALLLGATDRAIDLVKRFAACFQDARDPDLIEHTLATLVGQRVFGIALGYEDLVDHDQLRHDPVLAVLGGKLTARRADCAPLAGKSTLNRLGHALLELAQADPRAIAGMGQGQGGCVGAVEGAPWELAEEDHALLAHEVVDQRTDILDEGGREGLGDEVGRDVDAL
jgi:DDE family transposase